MQKSTKSMVAAAFVGSVAVLIENVSLAVLVAPVNVIVIVEF